MNPQGNNQFDRPELAHIPATLDDLAELRRRLAELDVSPQAAKGVVGWLLELATGEDTTSEPTRTRYRKVLVELDRHAPGPKRRRRRGSIDVAPILALAPALHGTGRPAGVVLAAVVAPIMHVPAEVAA